MSGVICPSCDTEHSASALSCPNCQRLVHAEELKALGMRAEAARERNESAEERSLWLEAMALLPRDSRQRATIERRVAALEAPLESSSAASDPPPSWANKSGVLGAIAFALWKAKAFLLLGLGKLKFLILGFSKMGTLLSFLASFGVYWSLWGWRFALGFLVAMYIHEMGHVAALRRYGIAASAPMFVPGLGAFVRLNQHPPTVHQDARTGLAGPEWGLGAALAAYSGYALTGAPIWAAIGHSAAFLNLFNLLPIWQLDGSRGFAALVGWQRFLIAVAFAVGWMATREGLLGLLCVVALFRAFVTENPPRADEDVFARFLTLIAAFCAILVFGAPRGF